MNLQTPFWSLPTDQVLLQMHSTTTGLSSQDAKQRLVQYGANSLKQKRKSSAWMLLLNQFKSPIILILIFAAVLSIFLKDAADAIIILAIVLISGLLGFWQEHGASNAVEKLWPWCRLRPQFCGRVNLKKFQMRRWFRAILCY
jgi:Mg2+-importing ATPase